MTSEVGGGERCVQPIDQIVAGLTGADVEGRGDRPDPNTDAGRRSGATVEQRRRRRPRGRGGDLDRIGARCRRRGRGAEGRIAGGGSAAGEQAGDPFGIVAHRVDERGAIEGQPALAVAFDADRRRQHVEPGDLIGEGGSHLVGDGPHGCVTGERSLRAGGRIGARLHANLSDDVVSRRHQSADIVRDRVHVAGDRHRDRIARHLLGRERDATHHVGEGVPRRLDRVGARPGPDRDPGVLGRGGLDETTEIGEDVRVDRDPTVGAGGGRTELEQPLAVGDAHGGRTHAVLGAVDRRRDVGEAAVTGVDDGDVDVADPKAARERDVQRARTGVDGDAGARLDARDRRGRPVDLEHTVDAGVRSGVDREPGNGERGATGDLNAGRRPLADRGDLEFSRRPDRCGRCGTRAAERIPGPPKRILRRHRCRRRS